MIELSISKEDLKKIDYYRFNHKSEIVQKRMHVIIMKDLNLPHQLIGQILNIHINTITKVIKMYKTGGIEKLMEINYGTNKSELESYKLIIEESFKKEPVYTIKEAQHRIEKLTGLRRSHTQIRKFLKKIGLKCRKMGYVPSKADPEKQMDFLKKNSSH